MDNAMRSADQLRYIALNELFLQEVAQGKNWSELQPILDEMKELSKRIEDVEASNVFVMHTRKDERAV